jgi:hypothetical protein
MVLSFYGVQEDTDEEWEKFWRRFHNHEEKLGNALLGGWLGDMLTAEPLPDIDRFHRQRLAATYVDIEHDRRTAAAASVEPAGLQIGGNAVGGLAEQLGV